MRHADWRVVPIFIGVTPAPAHRYELTGKLFRGEHPKICSVNINRENCEYLLESLRNAQLKKGSSREDYRKNKDDERNLTIDQRITTHHSDAFDTLVVGVCEFFKPGSGVLDGMDVVVN